MARKKKSDEVVEDIQEVVTEEIAPEVVEESTVEEVVEEKPKAKRGRKAKVEEAAIEEAPIEESIVEETPTVEEIPEPIAEPIVEEAKEEPIVKETPKVKKAKAAEKVEEVKAEEPSGPYAARVNSIITHSRRGPGMAFPTARTLNKGSIVHISEVNGNWGKISQNTWININYVDKI